MNKTRIYSFFRKELQFYIFILFSILLPFSKEYLPHVTFAWVVSATFSIRKVKLKSFKYTFLLLYPVLFYIIHVIGLIYSDHVENGIFSLEKKLSILFIPLVAIFMTEKVKINYRLILKIFVFANLIASIFCLFYALYQSVGITETGTWYFETSHWSTLSKELSFFQLINNRYSNFSYGFLSIFQHPTYFSTYILFSIAIIVWLIRSSQKQRHLGYYVLIIYFSVIIWLLGSRAAYITYLIGLLTFFIILILKYKRYWIGAGVMVVGILIFFIALSNKKLHKNIKEVNALIEGQSLSKNSDVRFRLWRSGFDIFKENIWFGVGMGDLDEAMNKKIDQYHDLEIKNEEIHNPHNQYLTVAINLGMVGLIIFLSWIIITIIITIKRKQFLFFYFMLIIAINLFFESMLNLIAGISFFVFFYSLLYSLYNTVSDQYILSKKKVNY